MNRSRLRDPRVVEGAIVLFFALALQFEVWIWWVPDEQGPKPFAALMGLLLTLTLVARRTAPLASLVAGMGVLAVWTLAAVPQGSLVPWLRTRSSMRAGPRAGLGSQGAGRARGRGSERGWGGGRK